MNGGGGFCQKVEEMKRASPESWQQVQIPRDRRMYGPVFFPQEKVSWYLSVDYYGSQANTSVRPMRALGWWDQDQAFQLHPPMPVSLDFMMTTFLKQKAPVILAHQLTDVGLVCLPHPCGWKGEGVWMFQCISMTTTEKWLWDGLLMMSY